MSLDAVKNFGKVTASTGYDSAATNIVLTSGQGAKLPDPSSAGAFNLVWFNSTDYTDPADDPNVEIVRCTARSTDTLTITRGQESTSASTKNTTGKTYTLILGITAKMITDINAALNTEKWVIDYTPIQAVNGSNTVFTTPVPASQVVVYPDGQRAKGNGVTYTFDGNETITFGANQQPYSSISIDYLPQ